MKKVFFILIATIIAIAANAQSHLQFMGIDIDGNCSSFVQKLSAKGFTLKKNIETGGAIMNGTFTGKDVEVYILVTPISKKVKSVSVYYPKDNSCSSIKYDYFKLKDSFKQKYQLENEFEFFSDPYYEGDGYEMQAVRNDKCNYVSFFKTDLGGILLE